MQKYLPWFTAKPSGDDDGVITVEQLLSHVSGLQREAGDHWSTNDFPTEAELKALYSSRQAAFAPNVRWKYSNLAFAVAGLVPLQLGKLDQPAVVTDRRGNHPPWQPGGRRAATSTRDVGTADCRPFNAG